MLFTKKRSGIRSTTAAVVAAATMVGANAAIPAAYAQTDSISLVVDVSGSMSGTRLTEAKAALNETINNLKPGQAVSLRSFEGSCNTGGKLLVPRGANNRDALRRAVANLSTGGGTPTPSALRAAYNDLPNGQGTVVLVSDGESTCGDPCVTAKELAKTGTKFRVHTVGYKLNSSAETEMRCVADATGGKYVGADNGEDLLKQIDTAVNRPDDFGELVNQISSLRDDLSSDVDPEADTSSQSSQAADKLSSDRAAQDKLIGIIAGVIALVVAAIPVVINLLERFDVI